MKIKVSEAKDQALDWLVAKCEGVDERAAHLFHDEGYYNYSTDWSAGGPIIEREKCIATLERLNGGSWRVQAPYDRAQDRPGPYYYGPTPLVAAMRCYVASKLGDEVEIPEELK
jgi:hypothetical protein